MLLSEIAEEFSILNDGKHPRRSKNWTIVRPNLISDADIHIESFDPLEMAR
jgi:hypothetical protein